MGEDLIQIKYSARLFRKIARDIELFVAAGSLLPVEQKNEVFRCNAETNSKERGVPWTLGL